MPYAAAESPKTVSQKSVEMIIGKLATDEEFRSRFHQDPGGTVRDLAQQGMSLTHCEIAALVCTDPETCERFAASIDPRLQKASLKERAKS